MTTASPGEQLIPVEGKILTDVVSLASCASDMLQPDKMGSKVHTYAELKNDPSASLPDAFTICSSIMTVGCQSFVWPTFFDLLDSKGNQFLAPITFYGAIESKHQRTCLHGNNDKV